MNKKILFLGGLLFGAFSQCVKSESDGKADSSVSVVYDDNQEESVGPIVPVKKFEFSGKKPLTTFQKFRKGLLIGGGCVLGVGLAIKLSYELMIIFAIAGPSYNAEYYNIQGLAEFIDSVDSNAARLRSLDNVMLIKMKGFSSDALLLRYYYKFFRIKDTKDAAVLGQDDRQEFYRVWSKYERLPDLRRLKFQLHPDRFFQDSEEEKASRKKEYEIIVNGFGKGWNRSDNSDNSENSYNTSFDFFKKLFQLCGSMGEPGEIRVAQVLTSIAKEVK